MRGRLRLTETAGQNGNRRFRRKGLSFFRKQLFHRFRSEFRTAVLVEDSGEILGERLAADIGAFPQVAFRIVELPDRESAEVRRCKDLPDDIRQILRL